MAVHGVVGLAPRFPVAFGLPPVVLFLSASHPELAFDDSVLEIEPQGDKRETLLLDQRGKLFDFPPVEEQLAGAQRGMVIGSTGLVFGNVRVLQPDFSAAGLGIGLAEGHLPFAECFHFRPLQHQTCLIPLEDVVMIGSGAVLGNQVDALG